ncbi:MAG: nucleotidyltransferase domain-containing protein [Clostridiales bacterium]|nr:nucleotidyltransferase domain-containing protein [Clostridiales bacterium]
MRYNIPERLQRDIERFAKEHQIERVILFGSRARGDYTERSDIDLAVYGGNFDAFYWDIKEKAHTLLMLDIVDLNKKISDDLREDIERDGCIIYEKNG